KHPCLERFRIGREVFVNNLSARKKGQSKKWPAYKGRKENVETKRQIRPKNPLGRARWGGQLKKGRRGGLGGGLAGGPARPVATITWRRVGRKSLDVDIPHDG